MIEITSNNVRHLRPLSPTEQRVKEAWFRDQPTAQILALKLQRGGRFCVVQGDYSKRKSENLREGLNYFASIGAERSPSARFMAAELVRRARGMWVSAPVDPNGPAAA